MQSLADSIGCQRNVVLFASDVEDRLRVTSCKTPGSLVRMYSSTLIAPIRKHIKLAVKSPVRGREANAQNCIICSVRPLW